MKKLLSTLLLCLCQVVLFAQINLSPDDVFVPFEIAEIRITISDADKLALLDDANRLSDTYYPCELVEFKNSKLNESVPGAGIRLRGNTSRNHPKRSFKIDFREFGGSKFHDHKKFNLKAENNDPSFVREHLSLQLFREAEVPAARSTHTRLYINEEYMGLYLNVEQIDDEFVQGRFGDDTGNIYKCYWGSNLLDDGQIYNNDVFELKTNDELDIRTQLQEFVHVLNDTGDPNWKASLEDLFNVNSFIRYLAMEALLGHWDGYTYNKNNYYLYENPDTERIEFIAYDVDNTIGIDWIGRDWAERDMLDWPNHGDPRPLANNILSDESYRNRYYYEIHRLLETIFNEDYLDPILDSYKTILRDAVSDDDYFPLTFGFELSTFENSFTENYVADHIPYGLKPFIQTRISSALEQVPIVEITDSPNGAEFNYYPNPVTTNAIQIRSNQVIQTVYLMDTMGKSIPIQTIPNDSGIKVTGLQAVVNGVYLLYVEGKVKQIVIDR